MAFRIHDNVVRGEIDNRTKGVVRGKVWLQGIAAPLILDLKGNAWADLAGCLLTFKNKKKTFKDATLKSLRTEQRGIIGDITASRKVRVFDIPIEAAYLACKSGVKPPEHKANCLYIEWFSDFNGRVVIESTDCELTVSEPEWRLSKQDEEERAKMAASGMAFFMRKLNDAIERQQRGQKDHEEPWDEHDYEKFLKESDARTDKYGELLDKYGRSDEAHEVIEKEMGWNQKESTEEEAEERRQWIEEMNAAAEAALNEPEPEPDPSREGIDWIRTENGHITHPLQHRCFESAIRVWHAVDKLGLKNSDDEDLAQFVSEFQTTGAKLAGALGVVARDGGFHDAAFTTALLKRALDHLHKSQAGLEAVSKKNLLSENLVSESRKELFEIREGILKLMDEFRGRRNS